MFRGAGAAGRHQGNVADVANSLELRNVVAPPHAVAGHAIEHDLARAAVLHLAHPFQRVAPGVARAVRIAGVLEHAVTLLEVGAVDADHHALRAEARRELFDQHGIRDRGRIDGDFLRAGVEHGLRVFDGADSAGHAERDVEYPGDTADPVAVDASTLGARGDVVEHDLVGALIAIALGEHQDVAHDLVIAEANALYDLAVADVEAGDDAFGKNGRNSEGLIISSNKALPLMAAAAPSAASAARSAALRTPPDACQAICG